MYSVSTLRVQQDLHHLGSPENIGLDANDNAVDIAWDNREILRLRLIKSMRANGKMDEWGVVEPSNQSILDSIQNL